MKNRGLVVSDSERSRRRVKSSILELYINKTNSINKYNYVEISVCKYLVNPSFFTELIILSAINFNSGTEFPIATL